MTAVDDTVADRPMLEPLMAKINDAISKLRKDTLWLDAESGYDLTEPVISLIEAAAVLDICARIPGDDNLDLAFQCHDCDECALIDALAALAEAILR